MGFFLNWIFGKPETKTVVANIPKPMYHAMHAIIYINKEQELTNNDIVIEALDEYLRKRVWATNDKQNSTEIKRAPTFRKERSGTGSNQMRYR